MVILCKGTRRELTARRRRLPAPCIAAALVAAALTGCSSPPVNTQGARILHVTIDSRFVHRAMPLTLVTPAGGGAHRPLTVERTNARRNAFNRLQRCYERNEDAIDAFFDLADAVITVRRLIREAWTLCRWDGRPPRQP
jgi:hypothetical protein